MYKFVLSLLAVLAFVVGFSSYAPIGGHCSGSAAADDLTLLGVSSTRSRNQIAGCAVRRPR